MKYFYIFLINCVIVVTTTAQPTIDHILQLNPGDKYTVRTTESDIDIALITEGPNQTWDFSNVVPSNDASTVVCINPNTTPFADSVEVVNSNLALKPFGTETDTMHLYQYYNVNSNGFEATAVGIHQQFSDTNYSYSKWLDPQTGLKFPFSYGENFTDQYVVWMNHIPENTYILKDTTLVQCSAIGYGTVKTPTGTFQNALLVKTVKNWTWWNNYAGIVYKTQGTDIDYQWFVEGIKISVLNIYMDASGIMLTSYLSNTEFEEGGINNPLNGGTGGSTGGNSENSYRLNVSAAAGEVFSNAAGSLSWTLGEVTVQTTHSANSILTQGFCQAMELITNAELFNLHSEISVYPNPVHSILNIQCKNIDVESSAILYNGQGLKLKNYCIE